MKTLKSEEAITILEDMKVNISIPKAAVTQIKRNAALNMAIDALLRCSEIPNDSDTISRQAAIDAVKKNTFRLTFAEEQNCEGHVAWSANAVYSDVMEGALLNLPSAQPEPKAGHWIHKHERTTNTWECSNCGYRVNLMDGGIYKFCSACGEKKEDGEYG